MTHDADARLDALSRVYLLSELVEWQKLIRHFELSHGFSLVLLLVPDADGAALCRRELSRALGARQRKLIEVELADPEALNDLPARLLAIESPTDAGCVWIAGVEPEGTEHYPAWRDGWRLALGRLNPHRNVLRRHLDLPILLVGAPWLKEVLRETAPDIWSVRTLVARIAPPLVGRADHDLLGPREAAVPGADFNAPDVGPEDPEFALAQAERLRGIRGREREFARLLNRAARGFIEKGDLDRAEDLLGATLGVRRTAAAPAPEIAETLLDIADIQRHQSRYSEAAANYELALVITRDHGDRRLEARTLGSLGLVYTGLRRVEEAIGYFERVLAISREFGDRLGEEKALGNLGSAHADLGRLEDAVSLFEQALIAAREIGDRHGEERALGNLGLATVRLGQVEKAIGYYEQALVCARDIGDRGGEGGAVGNLGLAYARLGQVERAIGYYEQALVIAREIGYRYGEGSTLTALGLAYADLGQIDKATGYLEQALTISREIGDRRAEAVDLANLGVAYGRFGQLERSISHLERALEIGQEIKDHEIVNVSTANLERLRPVG